MLSSKLFNEVWQSRKKAGNLVPCHISHRHPASIPYIGETPIFHSQLSLDTDSKIVRILAGARGRLQIIKLIPALLACHRCCGNAVCQCNHAKAFVTGFTHRWFNTTICHKTCQCHCFNAKLFKVVLQICVGKSAGAMFAHDNYVLGLWC